MTNNTVFQLLQDILMPFLQLFGGMLGYKYVMPRYDILSLLDFFRNNIAIQSKRRKISIASSNSMATLRLSVGNSTLLAYGLRIQTRQGNLIKSPQRKKILCRNIGNAERTWFQKYLSMIFVYFTADYSDQNRHPHKS